MKKLVVVLLAAAFVCSAVAWAEDAAEAPAKEQAAKKVTELYVCPKCDMAAMQAGKCPKCGADLVKMHVLSVKDGKAVCCGCGADCKCTSVKEDDPTKCTCGKDVVTVPMPAAVEKPAGKTE